MSKDKKETPEAILKENDSVSENEEAVESEIVSPELMSKLPPEIRQFILSYTRHERIGSRNPIADKITSDHISTALTQADSESEREFTVFREGRWFSLAYFLIIVAVF